LFFIIFGLIFIFWIYGFFIGVLLPADVTFAAMLVSEAGAAAWIVVRSFWAQALACNTLKPQASSKQH